MQKKTLVILVMAAVLLCAGSVRALEPYFDPMERNLVFIEGDASVMVPVNGFRLTFSFDIDKGSFADAQRESARIIAEIGKGVRGAGIPNAEIVKGWDVMRQAKISFGSKGRKLFNRVTVEAVNFPEGKLHELIATIVDMSLSVSDLVSLENASVFVTDDVESKKKEEVLALALKALGSNATKSAEALNRKIIAAKRVFVTNEHRVGATMDMMDAGIACEKSMRQELSSVINVQKSFRVDAQIVDQIKLTAKVAGVYQVE